VLSRKRILALAAGIAASAGALGGCGSGTLGGPDDAVQANATVVRVVDGDTLVIDTDGVDERVRLIGIDTPESVDRNRPVMCFGPEASAHLAELLPDGTAVRLERDVEARDRYDRLLAYLYRASDGLFVNMAMVTDGYAEQSSFPPNVEHTADFTAAERQARTSGAGAWSNCDAPFER
jgi:micrococcal nuclease